MINIFQALGNENRRLILELLRDPAGQFPRQRFGDNAQDGICVIVMAARLGVSQPTATAHMKILHEAGLVQAKRIRQWVFYRRDEAGLRRALAEVEATLRPAPS